MVALQGIFLINSGSIFINIVGLGNVDLVEDIVADDYCLRNITPVVQFSLGTR